MYTCIYAYYLDMYLCYSIYTSKNLSYILKSIKQYYYTNNITRKSVGCKIYYETRLNIINDNHKKYAKISILTQYYV